MSDLLEKSLIKVIKHSVTNALKEDVGSGDVTATLISKEGQTSAYVISREPCIICGIPWFTEVFNQLDNNVQIEWMLKEGEACKADDIVCHLNGSARSILSGERTALNFLQTLSGTATTTNEYVKLLAHTNCQILDTRKTIPGLRKAQKYAVYVAGGKNHRIGLYDQILIKENHIMACGSISKAVAIARQNFADLNVEVETETLEELKEALQAGTDIIMLDNYTLEMMTEAVAINQDQAKLEVSGNVTLESIQSIAATGVDYISSGDLTKNLKSIDFSMRFK